MKRPIKALIITTLCLWMSLPAMTQLSESERKEGFKLLFDGKDLKGWQVYEGPEWKVDGGTLTGPSQSAGWIGTTAEYDNFVLRGEYWIDKGETHESNSGIFIRASKQGAPWVNGYEIQISLQDERNPTGSIYNRVPTHLSLMREIAPEENWNRFEIRACGSRIQVWINGEQVQDADLHDRMKGVIGFQQHHPGVTVKYRNLRLKTLDTRKCDEEWTPLFNGKDLTGWFPTGRAEWSVEDGVIIGSKGMGHLFTELKAKDFELRAMIRIRSIAPARFKPNNGIYFRAKPNPDERNSWPVGFEAQVWNHEGSDFITGSLYGRVAANKLLTRDEAWFSMRIRAVRDHIQIWVNGRLVTDTRSADFTEGHFGIQCHDPGTIIETRDIYWKEVR